MLHSYYFYYCSALFRTPPNVHPGGIPAHAPSLSSLTTVMYPHRIILPPMSHLSPTQNTKSHLSLHQTLLPPFLPRPHHACRVTNATPLPPPKSLLMSDSASSKPPFSAATDYGASSLCRRPSPCRKPQVLVSAPPTPPLLPAACKFISSVSEFSLP